MKTTRYRALIVAAALAMCTAWSEAAFPGWSYKRDITLSPATPVTNYQVQVTLTTGTFNYAHCNSAGNDLRFTDTNDVEMSYWIETWNTTSNSVIWVKVPASGTSAIRLYYSNGTASAASSGTNTFVFFDDFNRADSSDITTEAAYGKSTGGGSWTIDSQRLKAPTDATVNPNKLYFEQLGVVNYPVIMKTKIYASSFSSGDASVAGLSCCMDSADTYPYAGYCTLLRNYNTETFTLLNDWRSWGTFIGTSWSLSNWYQMEFRVVDPTTKNGDTRLWQVGSAEPSWSSGNFGSGSARTWGLIGFAGAVGNIGTVYFDDVVVRKYAATEPAGTVGAEDIQGLPSVNNSVGATNVTTTSAWLNGVLVSTGTSSTAWGILWGTNNPGQTLNGWVGGGTTNFGEGTGESITNTTQATGLMEGRTYYYAYWATNASGTNVAVPVAFTTDVTPRTGPFSMPIRFGGYTNLTETLTNFPALVVFTNGMGGTDFHFKRYPFQSANGWDLRFVTNLNDSGSLNYEIEKWNTNGPCYVWVQVPTIPGDGSGSIWATWGDAEDSNQLACTTNGATWDTNYKGVWHLKETPPTAMADSTINANNATPVNMTAGNQQNALVDGGLYCDGSTDYWLDAGTSSSLKLTSGAWSVGAWVKLNSTAQSLILYQGKGWSTYGSWFLSVGGSESAEASGKLSVGFRPAVAEANFRADQTSTVETGVWTYVVGTYDGASTLKLYVNGVLNNSNASASGNPYGSSDSLYMGIDPCNPPANPARGELHGLMDEARVSAVAHSSNWVWACYLNQGSNLTFNSYGTVESAVVGDAPVIVASAATLITTNSAQLNGTLNTNGSSAAEVYVVWDTNNWGETLAGWAYTNDFGSNTLDTPRDYATNTSYTAPLTPNTLYYCRFYAANASSNDWSAAVSFTTLQSPAVNNDAGATNRTTTSALLRGTVTAGNPAPAVFFALNEDTDPDSTDTSAWDRVIQAETSSGDFSATASGLTPNTSYWYRAFATNIAGIGWAAAASNFTTLPQQPFNLASNHTVNGGATLVGTNPAVTLASSSLGTVKVGSVDTPHWLYDFGPAGYTNLNLGDWKIATDNRDSFTLDLGGGDLVGDPTAAAALSTYRDGDAAGRITVRNVRDVRIGPMDVRNPNMYGAAGQVLIGSPSAPARRVQIAGVIGQTGSWGSSGVGNTNTEIYATNDVLVTDGTAAKDVVAYNDLIVKCDGAFLANDVTRGTADRGITLDGDLLGNGPSGTCTIRDLYNNGSPSYCTIRNFAGVTLRSFLTDGYGDYVQSGYLTITNIGGAVTISSNLTCYSERYTVRPGVIEASGDITIGGEAVMQGSGGDFTFTSSGGIVDIGTVDIANVNVVKLAPDKYSYIQNQVGTPGTDLRTDSGKKVFYGGGGTTFTQLKNLGGSVDGGLLVPGFGRMTADNSNGPETFGSQVSARVRDGTYNVGYDGLRGVVTSASGSGGAGTLLTVATFLYGSASTVPTDATMAWRTRTLEETNSLISDAVSVGGTGGDVYVLRMTYSEAALAALGLGTEAERVASTNVGLQQCSLSGWAMAGAGADLGPYASQTTPGNWGVDTNANTAWLVLNTGGVFAVGGASTVVAADAPIIVNVAVQNLTTNAADLVGYLSTGAAPVTVVCYWGTNDGGDTASLWMTNTPMGQPSAPAYLTNSLTDLIPYTPYSYRYYATNSVAGYWATGTRAFTTLGQPAVNNDAGATNWTASQATLRGEVTIGVPTPGAFFCLKKGSEGSAVTLADTGTWDRVIAMGAQSGVFTNVVTGLEPGSEYYYRCLATNVLAAVWAPASASFETLPMQPFNLASNHTINGGATLVGTNPPVTLASSSLGTVKVGSIDTPHWLYDFGPMCYTNLNLGEWKIATDNNASFTLDLGGGDLVGDPTAAVALSTYRGDNGNAAGRITVRNVRDVRIGPMDVRNTYQYGAAGQVLIGSPSAPARRVQIAGVSNKSDSWASNVAGNTNTEIYATNDVLVTDGTAAKDVAAYNDLIVKCDGAFLANDITWGTTDRQLVLDGDLLGDGASGACTVRDIVIPGSKTWCDIRNFTGVTLRNFTNALYGTYDTSAGLTITNIAGDVAISNLISYTASWLARPVSVTASGNISVGGTLAVYGGAVGEPNLTLTSSGGAITLASLDLSLIRGWAKIAAAGGGQITGALANFATNYSSGAGTKADPYKTTQTVFRAASGCDIYYRWNLATNAYLAQAYYKLADPSGTAGQGGVLRPLLQSAGTIMLFR